MFVSSSTKTRGKNMETYLWRKLVPKKDICTIKCLTCCWECSYLDKCVFESGGICCLSPFHKVCLHAVKVYLQTFYGLTELEAFRLALEAKEGRRIHYDKKM